MCGKNRYILCSSTKTLGSPPRVREKRFLSKPTTCTSGITPVCAGKTSVSCLAGTVTPGSPPHVREKLTSDYKALSRIRITPACAGKTDVYSHFICSFQDHPRECGKNLLRSNIVRDGSGSPPRVREKQADSSKLRLRPGITPASAGKTLLSCHLKRNNIPLKDFLSGITPASAGKTSLSSKLTVIAWDHPRECGKN